LAPDDLSAYKCSQLTSYRGSLSYKADALDQQNERPNESQVLAAA